MIAPVEHGGPNLYFGVGVPGTGARYARYILRPEAVRAQQPYPAAGGDRDDYPICTRNLPELLHGGESPEEIQDIHSCYVGATWRWEQERSRSRDPGTEYYYGIATFPVGLWPTPRQAQEMFDDFRARDFSGAPAIAVGHYNTGNYHLNFLFMARGIDGLKLQLGQRYFRMDEHWAEVYLRHMEPDVERREARLRLHLSKKAETRRFKSAIKAELRAARDRGRPITIDDAVQRVARTMRVPQRYVDYRRIELHPRAREAAQLVQRYATYLELSARIKRAPESEAAVGWRRQMHELGRPYAIKDELLTLWVMHQADPHFAEQVHRLAGSEAFDAAIPTIEKHLPQLSPSLVR